MAIVGKLGCAHCGAPIQFNPGEIVATCRYCGFTVVIGTGKAFDYEHSMLQNMYDQNQIEEPIKKWMQTGFLKPQDLAKKAKFTEKTLVYLPFWVISAETKSIYKGIFERVTPSIVKEDVIEKKYDWLLLARKATAFPTKEYDVPLKGKVPYDFRKIEAFAQVFNSEVDKDEAIQQARQQIEEHHRYLAQQDVDRIVEIKTELKLSQTVYLHAPIWFIKYEYKGKIYQLLLDGATGTVIKGDIPTGKIGFF